jgi:AhpC/TSA family protein
MRDVVTVLHVAIATPPGRGEAGAAAGGERRSLVVAKGRTSRANRTATLQVGDAAPDFTLPGHRGKETVQLHSWRGRKNVVLAFYPLDWTGV